jgi:hypothetical protein
VQENLFVMEIAANGFGERGGLFAGESWLNIRDVRLQAGPCSHGGRFNNPLS